MKSKCCPIECRFNKRGYCHKAPCPHWDAYRKATGKCETCGAGMGTHSKCDGCDMLLGAGHLYLPVEYRQHTLCPLCVQEWQGAEERLKRPITWEVFDKKTFIKKEPTPRPPVRGKAKKKKGA